MQKLVSEIRLMLIAIAHPARQPPLPDSTEWQ
jgi:hypothetical protein